MDHHRRSRMAGRNLGTRPATRDQRGGRRRQEGRGSPLGIGAEKRGRCDTPTGRIFVINAANRAKTVRESRHMGSIGRSNRCESDTVELTKGGEVVHYGGDTSFYMRVGPPRAKREGPASGCGWQPTP